MMIPVRCFSCGKVIGDKWEPFARRVAAGENPKAVLDSLGLDRYCCRRMIISHVEIIDEILEFYEAKGELSVLEPSFRRLMGKVWSDETKQQKRETSRPVDETA